MNVTIRLEIQSRCRQLKRILDIQLASSGSGFFASLMLNIYCFGLIIVSRAHAMTRTIERSVPWSYVGIIFKYFFVVVFAAFPCWFQGWFSMIDKHMDRGSVSPWLLGKLGWAQHLLHARVSPKMSRASWKKPCSCLVRVFIVLTTTSTRPISASLCVHPTRAVVEWLPLATGWTQPTPRRCQENRREIRHIVAFSR